MAKDPLKMDYLEIRVFLFLGDGDEVLEDSPWAYGRELVHVSYEKELVSGGQALHDLGHEPKIDH